MQPLRCVHGVGALLALSSCANHQAEPEPIEPARVLAALEAARWDPPVLEVSDETTGVGPRVLAAFAVVHHPRLVAARAEIGVRSALLVQAGLLPDPQLGWDAMNVLAVELTGGTATSVDYLAGLGLWFPLMRPGERDAKVGIAEWQREEALRRVAAAEWLLTRDVHVAYEEAIAADTLLEQMRVLTNVAQSTFDYFERAREAGAATAIQANLALGDLQTIRLDVVEARARARRARQALNALLGLPPDMVVALLPADDPSATESLELSVTELAEHAALNRPDLSALLARYEAAEQEVRRALSEQYPKFSVGTGIAFTLPIFSRWGGPAIATALAKRERLRLEFTAAVHAARREVALAHVMWEQASRELELVETQLLPNAERNLELAREALQEGEVTLLETLALQRALGAARTRHTETRARKSKSAWSLLAASGHLLAPEPELTPTEEESR